MRLLIGVIIMIMVIVGVAVYGNLTVRAYARDISDYLEKIEVTTGNESWPVVSSLYQELARKWGQAERVLPALLDHAELHDLEIALARIEDYIRQQEKSSLLNEISVAKELASNLPDQESLSLRNIF